MAKWEFVEWLLFWLLETSRFEFEWDNGNLYKSAKKHGVTTEEAETVFRSGLAIPLGIQISPQVPEQRLGIIGPTLSGKLLQIAFILRAGQVRIISARPAKRKERRQYEEVLRKITKRI